MKVNAEKSGVPGKFYKGRSQEKKRPLRLQFFLLRSPPV
jgi:hypothetical protein